jgi:hypothetical protein
MDSEQRLIVAVALVGLFLLSFDWTAAKVGLRAWWRRRQIKIARQITEAHNPRSTAIRTFWHAARIKE